MAEKSILRNRKTGEVMYPVTRVECIEGLKTTWVIGNEGIGGAQYGSAIAEVYGSVAFGDRAKTTAGGALAHGDADTAESNNSYYTIASGKFSHAEGFCTTSSGEYSHAEGDNTIANGKYSHAEGGMIGDLDYEGMYYTTAEGASSHAEGIGTKALGKGSHTEGIATTANNNYEHASGQNNISTKNSDNFGDAQNTLFSIGNGEFYTQSFYNKSRKHNAFEVKQNGDIYISDTTSTATNHYFQKPMIKLQEKLASIPKVWFGTSSEYNALDKDENTIYFITENGGVGDNGGDSGDEDSAN